MRVMKNALVVIGFIGAACAADVDGVADIGEVAEELGAPCIDYSQRDITAGPPEYDFWGPTGVSDHGDVYGVGIACDDDFVVCTFDLLALDEDGDFSLVVPDFSVSDVNRHGDSGGCVVDEDLNGQAAIAHPNGRVELLPRIPGELSSCVLKLSDNETALVSSLDASFTETRYVAKNRRTYPVPILTTSTPAAPQLPDVNDKGEIAGITETAAGDRAYRFDSRAQALTVLEPVSGDPNSWGLAINGKGEVLGYSFVFGGLERIGQWGKKNEFETAFVEGTPQFPTVSNQLIWNEKGLIVVSDDRREGKTYVIPQPGVRLDLANLVNGASVPPRLFAYAINERGDFLAQGLVDGNFYLFSRTH